MAALACPSPVRRGVRAFRLSEVRLVAVAGLCDVPDPPRLAVVPSRWRGGRPVAGGAAVYDAAVAALAAAASLGGAGVFRRDGGGDGRGGRPDRDLAGAAFDPGGIRGDGAGVAGYRVDRVGGDLARAGAAAPALDGAGLSGDAGAGGVPGGVAVGDRPGRDAVAGLDRAAAVGELGGAVVGVWRRARDRRCAGSTQAPGDAAARRRPRRGVMAGRA